MLANRPKRCNSIDIEGLLRWPSPRWLPVPRLYRHAPGGQDGARLLTVQMVPLVPMAPQI
jgi:hypothetical protein